jgi:hypothetical protein
MKILSIIVDILPDNCSQCLLSVNNETTDPIHAEKRCAIAFSSKKYDYLCWRNDKRPDGCPLTTKKTTKEKELFIPNDNDIEKLYDSIIEYFDESLRPATASQKAAWCGVLSNCIRLDGYTLEQVETIIKKTRTDDFWKTNFLSVLKLRQLDRSKVKYIHVFNAKVNATNRSVNKPDSKRCNSDWNQ